MYKRTKVKNGLISFFILLFFIVGLCFFSFSKKEYKKKWRPNHYFLCAQIQQEVFKNVKVSRKKSPNGIIIVMTCSDPETVESLHKRVTFCQSKSKIGVNKYFPPGELMSTKGINTVVNHLNNGIRIELKSEDKELVKRIKQIHTFYSPHLLRKKNSKK